MQQPPRASPQQAVSPPSFAPQAYSLSSQQTQHPPVVQQQPLFVAPNPSNMVLLFVCDLIDTGEISERRRQLLQEMQQLKAELGRAEHNIKAAPNPFILVYNRYCHVLKIFKGRAQGKAAEIRKEIEEKQQELKFC